MQLLGTSGVMETWVEGLWRLVVLVTEFNSSSEAVRLAVCLD